MLVTDWVFRKALCHHQYHAFDLWMLYLCVSGIMRAWWTVRADNERVRQMCSHYLFIIDENGCEKKVERHVKRPYWIYTKCLLEQISIAGLKPQHRDTESYLDSCVSSYKFDSRTDSSTHFCDVSLRSTDNSRTYTSELPVNFGAPWIFEDTGITLTLDCSCCGHWQHPVSSKCEGETESEGVWWCDRRYAGLFPAKTACSSNTRTSITWLQLESWLIVVVNRSGN